MTRHLPLPPGGDLYALRARSLVVSAHEGKLPGADGLHVDEGFTACRAEL